MKEGASGKACAPCTPVEVSKSSELEPHTPRSWRSRRREPWGLSVWGSWSCPFVGKGMAPTPFPVVPPVPSHHPILTQYTSIDLEQRSLSILPLGRLRPLTTEHGNYLTAPPAPPPPRPQVIASLPDLAELPGPGKIPPTHTLPTPTVSLGSTLQNLTWPFPFPPPTHSWISVASCVGEGEVSPWGDGFRVKRCSEQEWEGPCL